MTSTPLQHLHKGMLNYSLIIRESPLGGEDTHWLLIGTSIIKTSCPEVALDPTQESAICPNLLLRHFHVVAPHEETFQHLLM